MKKGDISLSECGKYFEIRLPIWQIAICRNTPKRRWDRKRECWRANVDGVNARYILEAVCQHANVTEEAQEKLKNLTETCLPEPKPYPLIDILPMSPHEKQQEALDRLWQLPGACLFMEMGTGKTKTSLDLIRPAMTKLAHALLHGNVEQALVLCPLSAVHNWKLQIALHYPGMRTHAPTFENVAAHKESAIFRKEKRHRIMILGIESMSRQGKAYALAMDYVNDTKTALIIDEIHLCSNEKAGRTNNIEDIATGCSLRVGLTGSPIEKLFVSLFSIFKIIAPEVIGAADSYAFRARYCEMGGFENKKVVAPKNTDELLKLISPYSFICTKAECLDLPPKTYEVRHVTHTPEQKDVYRKILRDKVLVLGNDEPLEYVNAFSRDTALQQVNAGFVVKNDDIKYELVPPENDPKLLEILDILGEHGGSVIVWCRFIFEIERLAEAMRKQGITCEMFTGRVPPFERGGVVARFQEGAYRVFLANAQTGGVSIELTRADLVIYYSNTYTYRERAQSEDRAHRMGQTKSVHYIDLIYPRTIDEKIHKTLQEKKDYVSYFVDEMKTAQEKEEIL